MSSLFGVNNKQYPNHPFLSITYLKIGLYIYVTRKTSATTKHIQKTVCVKSGIWNITHIVHLLVNICTCILAQLFVVENLHMDGWDISWFSWLEVQRNHHIRMPVTNKLDEQGIKSAKWSTIAQLDKSYPWCRSLVHSISCRPSFG